MSSLTRYKQGKFAIHTHQIYIFIISNCLAVFTENLRYIALKFVAHQSISQNIPSSSNVTLSVLFIAKPVLISCDTDKVDTVLYRSYMIAINNLHGVSTNYIRIIYQLLDIYSLVNQITEFLINVCSNKLNLLNTLCPLKSIFYAMFYVYIQAKYICRYVYMYVSS